MTEAPLQNTKPKAGLAGGALMMLALKFCERSIGFVSTLLLARILTPADFGLVAMAMSVVGIMELMGAFGFDVALIQRQDTERKHYDTAWSFAVIFGFGTGLMLLALAFPAARFYSDERLTPMLCVLALGAMVQGFENIGTVNFRKDMNFKREFAFVLSKKLIAFVVTIGLAFLIHNYWALIAGIVTGRVMSVFISYRAHPFRPRFSLAARDDLLHFSKWLFVSNLLVFLQNKSDSFILGRTVGAFDLGLYNVASEIAVMPSTELVAPINRAVFPAYSQLSSQIELLRAKFLEVFGTIAVLAIPISVGLVCVADSAVNVLLGPQWRGAIPLLQIFTLCGLASALQSNLILMIVALGKPKANTLLSAAMLVIYLPSVVYASMVYGVIGAARVHFVMSVVVLIPLHVVFLRLTGLTAALYFATLWRPVCAAALMAVAVLGWQHVLGSWVQQLAPIIMLVSSAITGTLVYVLVLLGLWHLAGRPRASAETLLLQGLSAKLRPARAALSSSN